MNENSHRGPVDNLLLAGHEALARGAWAEARARFESALSVEETPEALEGLGLATWWLDDAAVTFDARQRAYRLYRQREDRRSAARTATYLALDYFSFRGEYAICNGWRQRAYRLLEGLEPGPEHGWLAVWDGYITLQIHNDTGAVQRLSKEAAEIGHALGVVDLEMLALALQGLALVYEGQVTEGMQHLDEATTAAVSGEMTDRDASATTCCYLISACERVRDYGRAAQWCDYMMKQLTAKWEYPLLLSVCRTHYAGVLIWRGEWEKAEAMLITAMTNLAATRPAEAAESIVRLANLRRRQGRFEEAKALLMQAESAPYRMMGSNLALLAWAGLALDEGDAPTAMSLAQRFLRGLPARNRLERPPALELLALAQLSMGAIEESAETCTELQTIAAAVGTDPLRAASSFIGGAIAGARGDHELAVSRFEDAIDLYASNHAPFEAARSRGELANSLMALGRYHVAEQQARQALHALDQLGAAQEGSRAASVLRTIELASVASTGTPFDVSELTPREREVLHLVAQGKSNPEIAAALVLSVRTVERHVSSIYDKIGTTGKAARAVATAYAFRHGLTQL